MIAKLTGRIDSTQDGGVVLDVGGVGYGLLCSARTLGRLPGAGEAAMLWVEMQVREDAIQLYGFIDTIERDWFRLLGTVQGVGARVALSLLSALSPSDLAAAIIAGDKAMLSRAPGVGGKLAARLVTELKEKAAAAPTGGPIVIGAGVAHTAMSARGAASEAVSALMNLGTGRAEALAAVARAAERLGSGADLQALIREALKELKP